MFNELRKFESRIAMWGPPASGKSWLLRAFGRELAYYNEIDANFNYILSDENDVLMNFSSPPHLSPTVDFEDHLWRFQRRPKISSASHQVSSHTHFIISHDASGGKVVQLDEVSKFTLINSDCLLLLLDPTIVSLSTTGDRLYHHPLEMNQDNYYGLVMNLLHFLESEPRQLKYLAVCVTKIDTLRIRGNPWDVIRSHFGARLHEKLLNIGLGLEISAFCVSSFGYLRDSVTSTQISNCDPETGYLKDTAQWMPYNVTSPFFWFFENIERQRLSQDDSPLARLLFDRDRQKKYIPYPKLVR